MRITINYAMLRSILFWTHLTAGVAAGAIILLMSATGVALTYEKQVLRWADARTLAYVGPPVDGRLSADSLLQLAHIAKPDTPPTAITLRAGGSQPAMVSFGRAGVLYLHPSSGAVLGPGNTTVRAFFTSMTNWHRWLAGEGPGRARGRAITGACNLAFLVLVLSGMILWTPKTLSWIKLRSVLWFRATLTGKAREFNWHNVLGIWSAVPLIAIVASGVVISYPWAGDLVYRIVGETPPPRDNAAAAAAGAPRAARADNARPAISNARPAISNARVRTAVSALRSSDRSATGVLSPSGSLEAILAAAIPLMPDWKVVTLQIPKSDAVSANVVLDRGTGGQPQHRATVTVTTATATVATYQPFDSLSTGRRARSVLRFAHTGEVLGLTGQTIAGVVSFAAVILVYTGLALSLRRAAHALARRRRGTVAGAQNSPLLPTPPLT